VRLSGLENTVYLEKIFFIENKYLGLGGGERGTQCCRETLSAHRLQIPACHTRRRIHACQMRL
jgi:hypothetical protein